MIARWLTQRCRDDDVPQAAQVRPGLARLLEEQYPASPLTDPWEGRTRADTWSWHHGRGRGIVWLDRTREVLWLLCFADEHDGGYDLGHQLVEDDFENDRLYPRLDPTYDRAYGATAPWGDYPDDDALEWARFLFGALEFVRDREADVEAGGNVEWKGAGYIAIAKDDDFLRLTIGTRLAYDDPAADRDRYLSQDEVEDVFLQLTGDLEEELWQAHVEPWLHWAVNFIFVPPVATPTAWLEARITEVVGAKSRRGVDPSRI